MLLKFLKFYNFLSSENRSEMVQYFIGKLENAINTYTCNYGPGHFKHNYKSWKPCCKIPIFVKMLSIFKKLITSDASAVCNEMYTSLFSSNTIIVQMCYEHFLFLTHCNLHVVEALHFRPFSRTVIF